MLRSILILLLLVPNLLSAQKEVEREVLTVVDRFFAAMTARDTTAMAQTIVREGMLHIASVDGSAPLRSISHAEYLVRLSKGTERYVERYWNPELHVHGTIASASMDYDFHVDGKFSHCGVDLFNLVKGPDGWRIASVSYTRQTEGCGLSPLGPLKP